MIPKITVDANLIIRYLLADHPSHFSKAKELFQKAQNGEIRLYINEVTVAEVVWTTVSKRLAVPKSQICPRLSTLISQPFIYATNKKALISALNTYERYNIDYIDAWLFVVSGLKGQPIASFDTDFKKLKVKLYSW